MPGAGSAAVRRRPDALNVVFFMYIFPWELKVAPGYDDIWRTRGLQKAVVVACSVGRFAGMLLQQKGHA